MNILDASNRCRPSCAAAGSAAWATASCSARRNRTCARFVALQRRSSGDQHPAGTAGQAQPAQPPVHELPHGHALGGSAGRVRMAGWTFPCTADACSAGWHVRARSLLPVLCTFCGCNMRLARNHALAAPYVATVLREFALYPRTSCRAIAHPGRVASGGGTPTYLPAGVLDALLDGILQHCARSADADLAIEVDHATPRASSCWYCGAMASTG